MYFVVPNQVLRGAGPSPEDDLSGWILLKHPHLLRGVRKALANYLKTKRTKVHWSSGQGLADDAFFNNWLFENGESDSASRCYFLPVAACIDAG